MSNRFGSYPEDEPVIGATYQPDDEPVIGRPYPRGGPVIGYAEPEPDYDDDLYDEEGYWDEEAYYEEADQPARQPMFYVFLVLAAVVGGILVFLLFNLVRGAGGDEPPVTEFAVQIDSPTRDQRVEVDREQEVVVQASATEPIRRFELFLNDQVVDALDVAESPPDNRYRATLRFSVGEKGTYELFVRVFAASGASTDSSRVRVVAIEPVGERPVSIQGRVVADATLRAGPGETYNETGSLRAGGQVTITGKTRDATWLLVQPAAGQPGWVRRAAVEPLDTLDLVPVREVTPTPTPTATPEATPTPAATPTPSPAVTAPDFVPTDAVLASGGSVLRVTVSNVSNNAYSGPLVVAVGGAVPQQERVVDVNLAANGGSTVIEFPVDPPITEGGRQVSVTVDPANIVREQREDNNSATIVLPAPAEAPNLVISFWTVTAAGIEVTVQNNGGAMPASNVVVRVQLGAQMTSNSVNIALATGQSSPVITVPRPTGSGQATVTVYLGNQAVASTSVNLP